MIFAFSGGGNLANHDLNQRLLAALGKRGRTTYIPSSSEPGILSWTKEWIAEREAAGFKRSQIFSVDAPFSKRALREAFASESIVLSGGNTFYFLQQLKRARLLEELSDFEQKGGILCGFSAGSIIMTPTISLAGLVPGERDENTVMLKNLSGLALLPMEIFPHSNCSEKSLRYLRRYSKSNGRLVVGIPDGSGIIAADGAHQFVGPVQLFAGGAVVPVAG